MPRISEAPGWQARGGRASSVENAPAHCSNYSGAVQPPVALAVFKRTRWCTVAKITHLDGEPILAVAVKEQQGTEQVISVPLLVLNFAERQGCRWLYWRRDRLPLEMRRIGLAELRATGWLQSDGELYIPLTEMEPVPWRRWRYADTVLHLEPPKAQPEPARQRSLWEQVA